MPGQVHAADARAPPRSCTAPTISGRRKVEGKTLTLRLSQQGATLLEEWIANRRRLDRLIEHMEGVHLRRAERLLKMVGGS